MDNIFERFPRWKGKVPDGCVANFLGVITPVHYWKDYVPVSESYPPDRVVEPDYPGHDEETFEWVDLLESVMAARDSFTMIELGAGWGRWITNAAFALKAIAGPPYALIAVEADPTHFRWLTEHVQDNGLDSTFCRLIQAAVNDVDGQLKFHNFDPDYLNPGAWYGQSIGGGEDDLVDAISLKTILAGLPLVDLIDLDVQSAEFTVLNSVPGELCRQVKKVHIGTHNQSVEIGLRGLFEGMRWKKLRDYPCGQTIQTEFGSLHFEDGVQTWINPALAGGA